MKWKYLILVPTLLAVGPGIVSGQEVLPQETGVWHFADNTTPPHVRCSATAPDGRLYVISAIHPDLFCSKDGGATWQNIPISSGDFFLNTLAISPDGDIYVAARYTDKLFRSPDKGESWHRLDAPIIDCRILKIYIDSNKRLYAVASNNMGVNCFRSNDDGMHWTRLGENISCLLFWNGKIYAGTGPEKPADDTDGDILVSVDDGATWSVLLENWAYFEFCDLLMNKKGVLFAQCRECVEDRTPFMLIRSQDGGTSWQSIHGGSAESQILLDAADNIIIKEATTYERDALAKSNDDGDSWARLPVRGSNALMDSSYNLLVFGNPDEGSALYSIYRSADQGVSWTPIRHGFGPADYPHQIMISPEGVIYAAAGGEFMKSMDQGKTWSYSAIMPYKMNNYVTALATHPSGYLYVTTSLDGIYRSVDEGSIWQRLALGTLDSSFTTMTIGQNGTIYAICGKNDSATGRACFLFTSRDNGATWQIKRISQNESYITRTAFIDSGNVLIAVNGEEEIYRSANEGDSWESEKIASVHNSWDIAYDPLSQQIYLMTDDGLYRRKIESPSLWEKLQNGLPTSLAGGSITYASGMLLVSFCEQNAGAIYHFYYSPDHGDHWTKFVNRASVFSNCGATLAFHPAGLIYAGLGVDWSENCRSDLFFCQAPFMNDAQVAPGDQGLAAGSLPLRYELSQNYPNPFNPSTLIRYALPHHGPVKLEVFDILGRQVAVLTDGIQLAGYYQKIFINYGLASGVYFYRLTVGDYCEQKKMILIQ